MTRLAVSVATLLAIIGIAPPAHAQRLLLGGGVGLGTGLERSDVLQDRLFRRARTRIIVPFDLRVDDDTSQGIGLVGVFEVEPHVSLGAEVRYMRWMGSHFTGFVGVTSVLAPRTLVGVDVGVDFLIPFNKSGTGIFIEPSLAALPFGSDLPDDNVLLWGLIAVGLHADL